MPSGPACHWLPTQDLDKVSMAGKEPQGCHAGPQVGGLRCRPPSIRQGSAPWSGEDWAEAWPGSTHLGGSNRRGVPALRPGRDRSGRPRVLGRNAREQLPEPRRAGRGPEASRDRLTPCAVVSWAGTSPVSTLRGSVQQEARNRTRLGMEKPPRQRWSPGWGNREKGHGRRLPLSLSSRLAVPESSSVQSEFSGNKITGCS